ncbi:isoaspartyl peptidase/L-asparaginase [Thalassoglobus sp. JC818]|uniref:isoaspartyl peptidase/L-asparaginase family protein n=1 Tax=Thalassoglobus sp. JC818 TaxID=3232136 RepID=UPI003457A5ED
MKQHHRSQPLRKGRVLMTNNAHLSSNHPQRHRSLREKIQFLRAVLLVLATFAATHLGLERSAFAQPADDPKEVQYAIVIHGGAGGIPTSPEWIEQRTQVLNQALEHGTTMLKEGRSSLETVEAVVRILEDSEHFNAGRGAVCNADGKHELDATIMDGRNRATGAVGGVSIVKNPISLARLVMTETPHVLLVTAGAEDFARKFEEDTSIEIVPNTYFATEHQQQALERTKKALEQQEDDSMGTVGCVAWDQSGNIAAATSTGGLTNKAFGRLGDSPIAGAGTFADNATCGVSCTGVGEDFIRNAIAYDISARMNYKGSSLQDAVREVLNSTEHPIRGGVIAIDHAGHIVIGFNTPGMSRAAADSNGRFEIHVKD